MIQMDEKPRMKSHYMKKYQEEKQKPASHVIEQSRPAGTQNLIRVGKAPQEDTHLNPSRRRILNDFISQRPRGSLESVYNRNTNDLLKMPGMKGSPNMAHYENIRAPPATIGPVGGAPSLL